MSGGDGLEQVRGEIEKLEKHLNLPAGFIDSLRAEDDWSLVVKGHAILEAALATLISHHLNSPQLSEPLSYLEMGHQRYGKIALTKALDLTGPEERRFLTEFSKLRNICAHRIDNISFTFAAHLKSLDKQQIGAFAEGLGYYFLKQGEDGRAYLAETADVLNDPKEATLLGLKAFLAIVMLQTETAKERHRGTELRVRFAELHQQLDKLKAEQGNR